MTIELQLTLISDFANNVLPKMFPSYRFGLFLIFGSIAVWEQSPYFFDLQMFGKFSL